MFLDGTLPWGWKVPRWLAFRRPATFVGLAARSELRIAPASGVMYPVGGAGRSVPGWGYASRLILLDGARDLSHSAETDSAGALERAREARGEMARYGTGVIRRRKMVPAWIVAGE